MSKVDNNKTRELIDRARKVLENFKQTAAGSIVYPQWLELIDALGLSESRVEELETAVADIENCHKTSDECRSYWQTKAKSHEDELEDLHQVRRTLQVNVEELEIQLGAWHKTFCTTQLTHAAALLEEKTKLADEMAEQRDDYFFKWNATVKRVNDLEAELGMHRMGFKEQPDSPNKMEREPCHRKDAQWFKEKEMRPHSNWSEWKPYQDFVNKSHHYYEFSRTVEDPEARTSVEEYCDGVRDRIIGDPEAGYLGQIKTFENGYMYFWKHDLFGWKVSDHQHMGIPPHQNRDYYRVPIGLLSKDPWVNTGKWRYDFNWLCKISKGLEGYEYQPSLEGIELVVGWLDDHGYLDT